MCIRDRFMYVEEIKLQTQCEVCLSGLAESCLSRSIIHVPETSLLVLSNLYVGQALCCIYTFFVNYVPFSLAIQKRNTKY